MEFNILQHFKGFDDLPKDPFNGDEVGTSLFLTGGMGETFEVLQNIEFHRCFPLYACLCFRRASDSRDLKSIGACIVDPTLT